MAHDISRQGRAGREWQYDTVPVYGIFILNGNLKRPDGKFRTDVVLADRDTHQVFSDKLRMIFLELPYFEKSETKCETDFERWIYVLKHMETLERMPFTAQKKIFGKLADVADIDKMEEPMLTEYERDLKNYRDRLFVFHAAIDRGMKQGIEKGLAEGHKEGRQEEKIAIARNLKRLNLPIQSIIEATGLPEATIAEL